MNEFFLNYGLFLAKTITLVLGIVLLIGLIATAAREARRQDPERLEVEPLNDRYERMRDTLEADVLTEKALKTTRKLREKLEKAAAKAKKPERARVFVLDFAGDLEASATSQLREEITAILQIARPEDEVLVKLESEGGVVHGYGLAASQLQRLRERKLRLTVAVDKVAASGGYLMACVADEIVAAPFAILGSIGVVAQIPNVHRLLKKHDVDVELHTAGAYKRTLTVFGENTEAGREKFREDLEDVHQLFKQFVVEHRPQLDMAQVATGEHWFGTRALALKLVDRLLTSDDWLLARAKDADLHAIRYRRKKPLAERLHLSLFRLLGLVGGQGWASAAVKHSAPVSTRFML